MSKKLKKITAVSIIGFFTLFSVCAVPMDALVVSAKGKTEIQKDQVWQALKVGDRVSKGAVIQTGFNSELILKIKESTVQVAPMSRVTVEQLSSTENKDSTKLFLDTGSLKSNVKKTADKRVGFTVRSPVATASVRGTTLEVSNGFDSTTVSVTDGTVSSWKNSSPSSATIDTDEPEDTPPIEGNSAAAISDGEAPDNSFLIRKSQTSSFSSDSSVSPMSSALISSSDIGAQPSLTPDSPSTPADRTGTIKVIVTIPE